MSTAWYVSPRSLARDTACRKNGLTWWLAETAPKTRVWISSKGRPWVANFDLVQPGHFAPCSDRPPDGLGCLKHSRPGRGTGTLHRQSVSHRQVCCRAGRLEAPRCGPPDLSTNSARAYPESCGALAPGPAAPPPCATLGALRVRHAPRAAARRRRPRTRTAGLPFRETPWISTNRGF